MRISALTPNTGPDGGEESVNRPRGSGRYGNRRRQPFRGARLHAAGMERVTGDHMGMPATVMNALAMRDARACQHCDSGHVRDPDERCG